MDIHEKTREQLIAELQELQHENGILKHQFEEITSPSLVFDNFDNESKEYFELIFNTSPDAAIITRLSDTKILKVNDGFTKITGYSREEALESTVLELNLWQNMNDRQEVLNELFAKDYCESYECVFVRKDGSTLTGLVSAKLFTFDGIPHIYSVTHDISKRKLAEEAKRESDELFKHIFEHSNVPKSITSLNNDIQINEAFRTLLGYSKEEIKNLNWPEITHPDDIELTFNNGNKIVRGEVNQIRFNKRYLHKNGSIIWADVSSSALRNKNGTIRCLITTIFDITEQRLAEQAIKESEERYRESQLIGNVAHWEYNFKAEKLYWSDQLYKIYGVTKSKFEPTLKNTLAVAHPDDKEIIRSKYFESIQNKTDYFVESRVITPDGEIKYLINRAKPRFDKHGNPSTMIGTVVDITERKKIEIELKNSQEELRKFSSYLLKVRENERAEITLEIHDSIAQFLVALKVEMGLYLKKMSSGIEVVKTEEVKPKWNSLFQKLT